MSLAPFPWFGGKSRVAPLVWERFGNPANFVEPFAGSLAVLLARPHAPRTETVNDKDAYLCNFWRAIRNAPEETAYWADSPVNETDLLARHCWLLNTGAERIRSLRTDADFYDAQVAGWWVWGLCSWIGGGWCAESQKKRPSEQIPHLGSAGQGINRKLPHLGDAGRGINRKPPHLGDAGQGERITEFFQVLSTRLRNVRVACGEWDRVLGESVTVKHGATGVFLDPPYSSAEHGIKYSAGGDDCAAAVAAWALSQEGTHDLRIAFCGYEGEHRFPPAWDCVPWKARGGYASQGSGRGRENAHRERIWFSPSCIAADLFTPRCALEANDADGGSER